MSNKVCNKCGESKGLHEAYFYRNGNRDGFMNTCKKCHRYVVRENQKNNANGLCPTCKQPKPSDET